MQFIRLAIALRYPIVGGLLLAVMLPAMSQIDATLQAVFMLDSYVRLLFLTFAVFSCASITAICFITIFYNIGDRREDPELSQYTEKHKWFISPFSQRLAFALMAIPLPVVAGCYTVAEQGEGYAGVLRALSYISAGGGAAMMLIWLSAFLERYWFSYGQPVVTTILQENHIPRRPNEKQTPVDRTFKLLGPGFVSPTQNGSIEKTRPGHVLLLPYTLALLAAYFVGYATLSVTDERSWLSILFFVVVLVAMGQTIMSFLSFFADRFSVPPLAIVGLWVLLTSGTNSYHEFLPNPAMVEGSALWKAEERLHATQDELLTASGNDEWTQKRVLSADSPIKDALASSENQPITPVSIDDLLSGWRLRQSKSSLTPLDRDLIIVTAAGGGIQAAAWTSRVLTGLHRQTDGEFSNSICMISAVSGGSLGSMMYLSNFPELDEAHGEIAATDEVLDHIDAVATEQSLTAAGWGMVFPDLIRGAVPFGSYLAGTHRDRGHAVEIVWRSRMYSTWGRFVRSDWRLRDLAAGIRNGKLPGVVFNSFGIDTGQRILISPCVLPDNVAQRSNLGVRYVEYARGIGLDLPITTAVRLSASFPYVTPTSTPQHGPWIQNADDKDVASLLKNVHFGDGGYTDNEGIMTALDFARAIANNTSGQSVSERGFKDIVLVRIAPFPLPTDLPHKDKRSWVVTQKYAGPPLGIYKARIASQGERGDWEFDLMKAQYSLAASKEDAQTKHESELRGMIDVTKELASDKSKMIENLSDVLDQSSLSKVKDEMLAQMPKAMLNEVARSRSGISGSVEQMERQLRSLKRVQPIRMHEVVIDFFVEEESKDAKGNKFIRPKQPPLSWRLSKDQKADLNTAWDHWLENAERIKRPLWEEKLRKPKGSRDSSGTEE